MGTETIKAFAARAKEASWQKDGPRPYFSYRDLGIKDATQGKVLAQVIRADQPCKGSGGYHSHDLEFQMSYMLKGWATMCFDGVGELRVEQGDAWYQPPGVKHELVEYSDNWEVIEITIPAEFKTHDETK